MEQYLKDYLEHLEMKGRYTAQDVPCEVCGSRENTVIRDVISIGRDAFGKLPVIACNRCGYLYQSPRFNRKFYDDYYTKHYRNVVKGNPEPDGEFIDDQKKRGELLYQAVKGYLSGPGAVLDVGCSVGTMLIPFMEAGWEAYGTDPDEGFVEHGRKKLGLPVEAMSAEDMKLEEGKYDFIMILGSLEHVYDPNQVLAICRRASAPGGYLLLEGRGNPQGESKVYFNHNHHRYLTFNSMELMMIKHGWAPVFSTDEPICGPTRPGGIYCMGRVSDIPGTTRLLDIISAGKKETPEEVLEKFDKLDEESNRPVNPLGGVAVLRA